jgi:hypothetical protein
MADRLLVSEDLNLRLHPYRQSRVQRCADPAFPLVCLPLMPKPWALTVWIWDSPERLRCGGGLPSLRRSHRLFALTVRSTCAFVASQ